jgi:hypothetical protein
MKWDVTIFYTNEYVLEEIIGDDIPEKYLINDRNEFTCASNTINSEKNVYQLINFLFQSSSLATEIYRDDNNYVLDLSALRGQLIDFGYLEEYYSKWIEETERENNMDEYGMLLDFIGYAKKSMNKQYLLMKVSMVENEEKEYVLRILINGERPDFRVFSVYLWGDDYNFDSEGDSYNPASRTWTWLYMSSRVVEEYFEIGQVSKQPLIFEVISPNVSIASRVAFFLAKETCGQIIGSDNSLRPYDYLTDKLGKDFNLSEALMRAEQSIWRESTLENPYPNIK